MKFTPAGKNGAEAPYLEEYRKNTNDGTVYYKRLYFDHLAEVGEVDAGSYEDEYGYGNTKYYIYLYEKDGERGIAIQEYDEFFAKHADYEEEIANVYLLPFSKLSKLAELASESPSEPQVNQ